ncbi:MAG: adenosylcobinamide-phosphate synthase CbiB [Oleiphilaceae bacterium]|nr:adenosylcobinamide-phosphate synthase CbiB [Oleiphilaceae bacterium]
MTITLMVCLAALSLDHWLGEPRRGHPLLLLGVLAQWVEQRLNRDQQGSVAAGAAGLLLVLVPPLVVILGVHWVLPHWLQPVWAALVLWLALGLKSLAEHGEAVADPLAAGDLPEARTAVGRIVSRDTQALDGNGVALAATESMLENGADAVFASLFWFVVAGLPGLVLHRVVNTMDALWGYRNARFMRFGRASARFDDVLGYLPARLTALTYALLGRTRSAMRCWRQQARHWDSPNAGPVMAAGAGALGVRLGGGAPYHGQWRQRPPLGEGVAATAQSIRQSIALVRRGVWLWLGLMALATLVSVVIA